MGTRGAIVKETKTGWSGVYHHWDSYPDGLGKTLFNLRNDHFKKDTKAILKVLIDEHKAGWSTIVEGDFTKEPGFGNEGAPQCYCHGSRKAKGHKITPKNAAECGGEYVYCFSKDGKTMRILSSYCPDGDKMVGMCGFGDPDAEWKTIAEVDLDGNEPDWKKIGKE